MTKQQALPNSPLIYYRLIALWVLNEALLGGIIHGFRIPVSGLVVGSCAVICICLIAWYAPQKGAILKATLIVAIFKMMLSPQAPLPAYIAVFFQGLMGELVFWRRRFYPIACILIGILALLESGLQRILILTIIYGNGLWTAINSFFNNLTGQKRVTDYSFFIVSWYILVHVIVGLMVGLWARMLPHDITQLEKLQQQYPVITGDNFEFRPARLRKKKRKKLILFIAWLALLALYIQSYFGIGSPLLPSSIALKIFIRSIIIVLAWYFIVGPLVRAALNNWLQKKKSESLEDINQVTLLLPATRELVFKSWQLSADRKGWKRILLCVRIILANTFHPGNV